MTDGESKIFEEAKQCYPIGTEYRNAHENESIYKVTKESVWQDPDYLKKWATCAVGIYAGGWIYYNGKWAEIISKPEVKPQEMEMEHGKWYYLEQNSNKNKWIVQFDKNDGTWMYHLKCQCTTESGKYTTPGRWGTIDVIKKESIRLADMEEVYKYFPEERPKEVEFKKGDVIYHKTKYYEYLLIFDSIDGDRVKGKQNLRISDGYNYDGSNYFNDTTTVIRKATLEEETHLKACIKANKFVPKEEKKRVNPYTDFEFIPGNVYVGSWNSGRDRCIFKPSTIYLSNHCYTIDAKDNYNDRPNGCCTGDKTDFRHATEEEKQWLEACIKAGKTISKEEAMKKEENLVGRYIKALVNGASGIGCIQMGDVCKLGRLRGSYYDLDDKFNKAHAGYVAVIPQPEHWEVMPEGWTPETPKVELPKKGEYWTYDRGTRYTSTYLIIDTKDKTDFSLHTTISEVLYDGKKKEYPGNIGYSFDIPLVAQWRKASKEEMNIICPTPKTEKPMSSELTSLPDKWCIKIDPDNQKVLDKFKRDKGKDPIYGNSYTYVDHDGWGAIKVTIGHTEITFEQFKKWVLKEEKPMEKPSIPEYVECLETYYDQFTKGKIYKTARGKLGDVEVDDKGSRTNGWNPDKFKPSTKEAVHCKTQEEWDFVRNKIAKCASNSFTFKTAGYDKTPGGLDLRDGCHCPIKYYEEHGYKVYSFDNYCAILGIPNPFKEEFKVGDWVKILPGCDNGHGREVGKAYHIVSVNRGAWDDGVRVANDKGEQDGNGFIKKGYYIKALPHEIPIECKIGSKLTRDYEWSTITGEGDKSSFSLDDICGRRSAVVEGDSSPRVIVDADVYNVKVRKSASVTLKNTENEVKISVKLKQPIKLN